MNFLVGVDGGGSKTAALIALLDGSVVGRGAGGSSNYRGVGIEQACASIDQALQAAFASANMAPYPASVRMACFGLAGVDRPGDPAPVLEWAASRWPGMPVKIVSDGRLVLAAGTPQGWGAGVICGTGSSIFGRSPSGQMARAGGWGYLLGDEGSGYDIGRAALRSLTQAADGRGPQTRLTGLILQRWMLNSPQDLVNYVYRPGSKPADIAALASLVDAAAGQGDTIARQILGQAGHELARGVKAVAGLLGLEQPVPCALAGGVMLGGETLRGEFLAAAAGLDVELSPIQPVPEPATGAILLARQAEI
jgi:N-acetylglucosamine kinase-like BadF-type ATPase